MEKAVVKLLKVKMLVMPGLIKLNSAASGERMYSYILALLCSLVSGRYSAGNSPDLAYSRFPDFQTPVFEIQKQLCETFSVYEQTAVFLAWYFLVNLMQTF